MRDTPPVVVVLAVWLCDDGNTYNAELGEKGVTHISVSIKLGILSVKYRDGLHGNVSEQIYGKPIRVSHKN